MFTSMHRHEIIRELIGRSVTDVMARTEGILLDNAIDSPDKLQRHPVNVVGYSAEFGEKVRALKRFLYERMYRHYRLVRMQTKAERFLAPGGTGPSTFPIPGASAASPCRIRRLRRMSTESTSAARILGARRWASAGPARMAGARATTGAASARRRLRS